MIRYLAIQFLTLALVTGSSPAQFGSDLYGNPLRSLTAPGIRAVVLIFAATDCPISNRYVPEIKRLNHEYSGRGVAFWWVFPNPEDTSTVVLQHNRTFSIEENTALDRQQDLVRLAHATTTPEAAVFSVERGALNEKYLGRIDDRYISIGQERPKAQHHDLEDAIAAVLSGKAVSRPSGAPVGCYIESLHP